MIGRREGPPDTFAQFATPLFPHPALEDLQGVLGGGGLRYIGVVQVAGDEDLRAGGGVVLLEFVGDFSDAYGDIVADLPGLELTEFIELAGGRRAFLPGQIHPADILLELGFECIQGVEVAEGSTGDKAFWVYSSITPNLAAGSPKVLY